MDQVTTDFLNTMNNRVTARQAQVDTNIRTALDKLDLLSTELVTLLSDFNEAHLLESDVALAGQLYEYDSCIRGLIREVEKSKDALTKLRRSVKQLDEVDARVGDPLRGT